MGIRFRKSINLGGGAKVNLSKSGIGFSAGTKGARVTKKAGGGTRATVSVPGTGISYVKDSKKGTKAAVSAGAANAEPLIGSKTENKVLCFLFRLLSLLLVVFGALLAIIEPVVGLAAVAFGIILWLVSNRYKNKVKHNGK